MIATIIIYQQIEHTKNRDPGYNTSQVIYMDVRGAMSEHFSTIKNELIRMGVAENAAFSINTVIRLGWYSSDGLTWQGKDPDKNVLIVTEAVTPEYISTLGMNVKEGRDFNSDAKSDTNSIVVNETLADTIILPLFGFEDNINIFDGIVQLVACRFKHFHIREEIPRILVFNNSNQS